MKKPASKNNLSGIIVAIIILILCVVIGISISKGEEDVWAAYSVNSDAVDGYSGFYRILKELKLKVKTGYSPLQMADCGTCQIIADTEESGYADGRDWAREGGILVYIADSSGDGEKIHIEETGKGIIITVNTAEELTNKQLLEDTTAAYNLYTTLCEFTEDRQIIFNEYYLLNTSEKKNIWTAAPAFLKVLLIQMALCVILYIFYAGKRFGKAHDLVEETERTENEYVYSAAAMYQKAGAWDLAVNSFFQAMNNKLNQLVKGDEPFLEKWENAGLPEINAAKQVEHDIKYMSTWQGKKLDKLHKKKVIHMLAKIEYLMKIIDKRREEYWKH